MGRQAVDQSQLFYLFNLEQRIPGDHLLRRINPIVARVLADAVALQGAEFGDVQLPADGLLLIVEQIGFNLHTYRHSRKSGRQTVAPVAGRCEPESPW